VLPDSSLLQVLWPAAAGIALMSFTESSAAARAFRRADDARVVPNQELVATGVGNVLGGLFGAMPSGGGTSQTAVNSNAGARSQMAGIVCAAIALATMLFLAPVIAMIPHAALAAIVIKYSIGLISFAEMRSILQVRAVEFRWAIVAFLGVMVLGTLKGILVAVLVSMLSLMYQSNNPMVFEVRRKPGTNIFRPRSDKHPDDEMPDGLLVVRVLGRIYFANASNVGAIVRELVDARNPRELILDCSAIPDFEYTALLGLVEFEADMRKKGVRLVMAALNPEARSMVNRTAIGAILAESNGLLPTVEIAVDKYTQGLSEKS
jgi:MFS superfamily sulfate permease-like transporter